MLRQYVLLPLMLTACTRGDPPIYDAPGFSPSISSFRAFASAASASPLVPSSSAVPFPKARATEVTSDPGALPQTKERPAIASEHFTKHAEDLFDAIVKDNAELALPFFFPLEAYRQVKDIPDQAADWKGRLVRAFRRDIHKLHREFGDRAKDATFAGIDVDEKKVRWIDPNEELNKLGYYRALHSKLRYSVDGKERTVDVTSFISWRGEWYVVHLTGFK